MKKTLLTLLSLILVCQICSAGGILTNANQSAQYVRMFSRNASTTFDAVYYNPAGLMKMDNGLYFSVNNQTIFQKRTINTTAPLNRQEFIGDVTAPVFPSAFAIYKLDNIAFSLGFGPNGGGGTATFDNGLPSFEGKVMNQVNNMLVPALAGLSAFGMNVTNGYDVDISFDGQSVFWGIQFGISAKVNDVLSVYGGARYYPSKNIYQGAIENIQLTVNNQLTNAQQFLTGAASTVTNAASAASAAANQLQPLIAGGGGAFTLAQLLGAGFIDASKRTEIEIGLMGLGLTQGQIDALNAGQIQATFSGGAASLTATASTLTATSALVGDTEVDTDQTGSGWAPIIGVNISPSEDINIGLKYEHHASLALTNDSRKGDGGFDFLKDGAEITTNIPALITTGIDYQASENLLLTSSFFYYFDKGVEWGNNIYGFKRTIDSNSWELAVAGQYSLSDKFAISAGYMYSPSGVSEAYLSDFSFNLSAHSVSGGIEWKINDKLVFDLGAFYTSYMESPKSFGAYSETYDQINLGLGFGLGYKIF